MQNDKRLLILQFIVFFGTVIHGIFLADYFLSSGSPAPYTITHSLYPHGIAVVVACIGVVVNIAGLVGSKSLKTPHSRLTSILVPFVFWILSFFLTIT